MRHEEIRMVATDLDGTLMDDSGKISGQNTDTLLWLGERNICRVIATGRNLFSAKKALPADLPVDYLVFSTGAGVVDWKTGELIFSEHLKENEVTLAVEILTGAGMSFMVHGRVPDNHIFKYFDASCGISDFHRRCELYKDYGTPLDINSPDYANVSQILAIVPENLSLLENVKNRLKSLKVIRTTSPLDGESMWIEIFPEKISKGHAVEWLCNRLGINRAGTVGIGNDYNDTDMLNFVHHPFVVDNAPGPMKKLFGFCSSNNDHGFSDAVSRVLSRKK